MASFNVHEVKTQYSKLLNQVLEGKTVVITRNGVAVAELGPARKRQFPLGAGRHDRDINTHALTSDEWCRPTTDEEDAFLDGRY